VVIGGNWGRVNRHCLSTSRHRGKREEKDHAERLAKRRWREEEISPHFTSFLGRGDGASLQQEEAAGLFGHSPGSPFEEGGKESTHFEDSKEREGGGVFLLSQ